MSLPFSLTYFDPPPDLARHVAVLFHFATELEHISDRQPGALGQLVIFARGTGEMTFESHVQPVRVKTYLMSGFSSAAQFTMDGPWHVIGASLTPLGWAALTNVPASEYIDRFVPAAGLLGDEAEDFGGQLADLYCAGQIAPENACRALGDWISARLGEIPAQHQAVMEQTIAWLGGNLNPDLDSLFAGIAYSRRQAERLVERYFGLPPAALARKYRAIRAAALLAKDDLTDEEEAVIADAFYDQPHMVREISRYCGYTPSRLGGEGQPILKTLLQMKNFDRLQQFKATASQ